MRRIVLNIIFTLVLMLPVGVYSSVSADCASAKNPNSPKGQVVQGIGSTSKGSDCGNTGVNNIVSTVVNIMSLIVGVVAIVMIISSGLKFVTSGGDSQKVANAKGTLIWALVGLAVAATAQYMVHYVIHTVTSNVSNST